MKNSVKILIAIFVLICITFIATIPVVNDLHAKNVEKLLKNIPCPEKTEIIESFSIAGKVAGNGNGMQYFGCVLLKSELNLDSLNHYFTSHAESGMDIFVSVQKGSSISQVENCSVNFVSDVSGDGYFIVYAFGDTVPVYSQLDLRGH